MNVTHIPRAVVRHGLCAARLPFTVAEHVLHREEDFPPALAFDAFGATVKQAAGSVLRDDSLREEGRLEGARTAELGRAQELEAEAARREAAADARLESRLETDDRQRGRVELETSAKLEAAARERDRKQQQANKEAAKRAEAARGVQAAAQRRVAKRERSARSKKLAAERKAVGSARKATGAKKAVKRVDRKLKNTQEARKA